MYLYKVLVFFLEFLVDGVEAATVMMRQPTEDETVAVMESKLRLGNFCKSLFVDGMVIVAIYVGYYHRVSAILFMKTAGFIVAFYCTELYRIGLLEAHIALKIIAFIIGLLGVVVMGLPFVTLYGYLDDRREEAARRAAGLEDDEEQEEESTRYPSLEPDEDRHRRPRHPVRNQALHDYLERLEDDRLHRQQLAELLITAHIFGYFDRVEHEQLRHRPSEASDLYRLYVDLAQHFNRQQDEEDETELSDVEEELQYRRIRIYEYLQEYYSFMEIHGQQQQIPPQEALMSGVSCILLQLLQLQHQQETGHNGGAYVLQQFVRQQEQQQQQQGAQPERREYV